MLKIYLAVYSGFKTVVVVTLGWSEKHCKTLPSSCAQEAVAAGATVFHAFVAELNARLCSSPTLDERVSG